MNRWMATWNLLQTYNKEVTNVNDIYICPLIDHKKESIKMQESGILYNIATHTFKHTSLFFFLFCFYFQKSSLDEKVLSLSSSFNSRQ